MVDLVIFLYVAAGFGCFLGVATAVALWLFRARERIGVIGWQPSSKLYLRIRRVGYSVGVLSLVILIALGIFRPMDDEVDWRTTMEPTVRTPTQGLGSFASGYENYLRLHPQGRHASEARQRIREIARRLHVARAELVAKLTRESEIDNLALNVLRGLSGLSEGAEPTRVLLCHNLPSGSPVLKVGDHISSFADRIFAVWEGYRRSDACNSDSSNAYVKFHLTASPYGVYSNGQAGVAVRLITTLSVPGEGIQTQLREKTYVPADSYRLQALGPDLEKRMMEDISAELLEDAQQALRLPQ